MDSFCVIQRIAQAHYIVEGLCRGKRYLKANCAVEVFPQLQAAHIQPYPVIRLVVSQSHCYPTLAVAHPSLELPLLGQRLLLMLQQERDQVSLVFISAL